MGQFGVPAGLAGLVSVLLPIAELAIAILLVPELTASMAAAGALLLLAVFVAAIGANLARGRRPECNCFGQLHSAPVGTRTIARNLLLAVLAALMLAGPGDAVLGVPRQRSSVWPPP